MSIIEQATKRLEELRRGGVDVPWTAAGLTEDRFNTLVRQTDAGSSTSPVHAKVQTASAPATTLPSALVRRLEPSARPGGEPSAPARVARESATVELDLARLAKNGLLTPDMVRSDLALEFRHIKRPILRNAAKVDVGSGRNKLVMVTSAVPAEGKTFCSINLAMSMAMEVDTSVLLVDADVVRPAILDRLGLPPARGFLDVLTDDRLQLSDVMLRTSVPKLSILPAGSSDGLTTELLASAAMDRLLLELAARYPDRIVILDAPPLLLTTESRVLASRVGQVIVVVDSSRTTTNKVAEAFAAVESCPLVMSVLNKCAEPAHGSGYGYGYGYGHQ